jgi:hypothetical protein
MERLTDAAGGGIDGGGVADETRTGPAVVPHGQGHVEMAGFDNRTVQQSRAVRRTRESPAFVAAPRDTFSMGSANG